jgi:hypothetical protein
MPSLDPSLLGWVDIGIGTKGKWGFVVSLEKVWEIAIKKFFNQSNFIAEVITFRVMQYIRGQKFFFHNVGLMGIKRRRILRRFQKYKLTLVTKCA